MNKEELIGKLNKLTEPVFLIDDLNFNPIEIVVISKRKRKIKSLLDNSMGVRVLDKERYRVVKVMTFHEIGIKQRMLSNHSYLEANSLNVYLLEPRALRMFMIYYACILSDREDWLSQNVIHNVMQSSKNGKNDKSELFIQVKNYLKKEDIKLTRIGSNQLLNVFRGYYGGVTKLKYKFFFGCRKMKREFVYRFVSKKNVLYKRLTQKRFVKKMVDSGYFGKHWEELQCAGSSGCSFFRIWENNQSVFLKGNTHSRYGGVANEICAQNILSQNKKNKLISLPMLQNGENKDWISFPYMEATSLKDVLAERQLGDKELERIGSFLVQTLDVLNDCEIVHNDLRLENIMVSLNDDNQIQELKVVDFGCSSVRNALPWSNKGVFGGVYSEDVCGNYRYNRSIVDDAASAYLVYCQAGGSDEYCISQFRQRIGRRYTCFLAKG